MKTRKTLKKVVLAVITTLLFQVNLFAQVRQIKHERLNQNALKFWYADPSKPATIFNQYISPKGDCIQYANGYLFVSWFKGGMNNRNLMLSRLNLTTNVWVHIEFPDKQTLYQGDYQGTNKTGAGDSHRTTCVGVSSIDGTVHLAYDMHAGPLQFRMSQKNVAFASDADFNLGKFSAKRNYFKTGQPIASFTYPSMEVNNAGQLICEYRVGTTRQGDKYVIIYDGNSWSNAIITMKGNNENPEFNQYGGFTYQFGKMYVGCNIRVKDSPIGANQGFYFAEAGQTGADGPWKNRKGENINVPVVGLTQMTKLKVAEPLPAGNDGMTSAPNYVVSKNGAVHFTCRVPNVGEVHYISKPGQTTFTKATGGTSPVSFGADDGKVYSIDLSAGKVVLRSTPEGENNWTTSYTWAGTERFDQMVYEYHNGKVYIIAAEEKVSDSCPMHLIILDLGFATNNTNKPPVVSFVTPTNNQVIPFGYTSLEITSNATDPDAGDKVDNVVLYIDNVEKRKESVPPFAWGLDVNTNETLGLSVGTHTLKAVATDTKGAITTVQITIKVERPTNLNDVFNFDKLSIYPNPSNGGVFNLSKAVDCVVLDAQGKVLFNGVTAQVNLDAYSKGIYLLKSGGDGYKLIKH
jgi:BNR repeat-containing family member/Bacterial Ig domain